MRSLISDPGRGRQPHEPNQLAAIVPADRKAITGLVPGYAGADNFLGFDEAMVDGNLVLDPTFEGGGGG